MAAKGKGDAPPDLRRLWLCRRWNIPPRAGGMDDQPYRSIYTMNLLDTVYTAMANFTKGQKPTDDEQKVILWLVKEKLNG